MKHYEAIFFDMDGTLIETKTGHRFPRGIWDWFPKEGVHNKILEFNAVYQPEYMFIVSNQSMLGKRKEPEPAIAEFKEKKMNKVARTMFPSTVEFDTICAPYKDEMRKPETGMGDFFANVYGVDLSKCLMVGDASDAEKNFSDSDKMFAKNCGMDYLDINDFLNYKF